MVESLLRGRLPLRCPSAPRFSWAMPMLRSLGPPALSAPAAVSCPLAFGWRKRKRPNEIGPRRDMVRKRGFEPPRGCPRQPLKLVRLPFRHFRVRGDFVDSPNLSATTAGSSAIVCRFSRSSWHFRFLTTDDNGGLPVRDSEQYMGEAGRRQTGHGTPTLRPQPRLERRNYRESWNLLKEHFDGVKVTDIDTRFLLGLRETRSQDKARRGRPYGAWCSDTQPRASVGANRLRAIVVASVLPSAASDPHCRCRASRRR
jgi:hypothetical protein